MCFIFVYEGTIDSTEASHSIATVSSYANRFWRKRILEAPPTVILGEEAPCSTIFLFCIAEIKRDRPQRLNAAYIDILDARILLGLNM